MSGKGFQKVKELHSITNPIHYAFTAPSRLSAFLILHFLYKCAAKRKVQRETHHRIWKSMLPEMHTHAMRTPYGYYKATANMIASSRTCASMLHLSFWHFQRELITKASPAFVWLHFLCNPLARSAGLFFDSCGKFFWILGARKLGKLAKNSRKLLKSLKIS